MAIKVEIYKKIEKCADYGCVWRSDKYENGCGKFSDLNTCIKTNGKMTVEEEEKEKLI